MVKPGEVEIFQVSFAEVILNAIYFFNPSSFLIKVEWKFLQRPKVLFGETESTQSAFGGGNYILSQPVLYKLAKKFTRCAGALDFK